VSDDAPRGSADLVLVRAAASGALGRAGPARLFARVVGAAARLCGARLASIALLTEGRDHLELRRLSDHTVRHHVEGLKLRFGKATLHGLLGLLAERHLLD
jgi:hypothetical protein